MRTVIAIDPGTVNTGLVYMDERRIIDARTVHFNGAVGSDNVAMAKRARIIWEEINAWMMDRPHDVVVIEGYKRYAGIKVAASTLHQTPWLCGVLIDNLITHGEAYEVQLSCDVLRGGARGSMQPIMQELAAHKNMRFIYEGQERLTNEHLRSAFCHGLYYLRGAGR